MEAPVASAIGLMTLRVYLVLRRTTFPVVIGSAFCPTPPIFTC